jgi:hypothetical protein
LAESLGLHPNDEQEDCIKVTKDFLNLNGWKFEPEEGDAFATLISISKGDSDAETTRDG